MQPTSKTELYTIGVDKLGKNMPLDFFFNLLKRMEAVIKAKGCTVHTEGISYCNVHRFFAPSSG